MNLINLVLFGLSIILLLIYLLIKISGRNSSKKQKNKKNLRLIKRNERLEKLVAIDKANEEYTKDDLIMAEREIKALKNSNFDLFYDEEKELHYRRLEDKYKSKWKGTTYFSTKKGAIYFISSQGKKIYIKKK